MQYLTENADKIGYILILIIIVYFLFRLGIRLANDEFYGTKETWAWIAVAFAAYTGFNWLQQKNPFGLLGFIPIMTYIIMRISSSFDFSTTTQKKVQGVVFSGIASAATYTVTHAFLGFGASEASISAVIAAGILGTIGYHS